MGRGFVFVPGMLCDLDGNAVQPSGTGGMLCDLVGMW